jgi:hypothetical protein
LANPGLTPDLILLPKGPDLCRLRPRLRGFLTDRPDLSTLPLVRFPKVPVRIFMPLH